ncbi:MAG: DUF63 family protein [Candidatus Micrarchaeia archaeon]
MLRSFIDRYFIEPLWQHEGYNIFNTTVYAIIALASAYLIFLLLQKMKIRIDDEFIYSIIPFIFIGSTIRVITDSIDTGVAKGEMLLGFMQYILDSHIYDYGYLTASPGIYVVIGLLTLVCVVVFKLLGKEKYLKFVGITLFIPHFLILTPMMKNFAYVVLILVFALLGFSIGFYIFKGINPASLAVFSHSLDGAATFVILDFFNRYAGGKYFEQHVIPSLIGSAFGTMLPFFLIKVFFSTFAAYIIINSEESEEEKKYLLLLLVIFGLAPGIRDTMRLLVGA